MWGPAPWSGARLEGFWRAVWGPRLAGPRRGLELSDLGSGSRFTPNNFVPLGKAPNLSEPVSCSVEQAYETYGWGFSGGTDAQAPCA